MRTRISLIIFFVFGFSSIANADAHIPAPIFYQLSKRLLNETQHFVEVKDAKKGKTVKANRSSGTLKCSPKKEQSIKNFGVLGVGNPTSLWKTETEA